MQYIIFIFILCFVEVGGVQLKKLFYSDSGNNEAAAVPNEDKAELTDVQRKMTQRLKATESDEDKKDHQQSYEEELRDLIDDNPNKEENGDDGDSDSSTKKRKKSDDEELEDQFKKNTIEENLDAKVACPKKYFIKRARRFEDEDEREEEEEGDREVIVNEFDGSCDREGEEHDEAAVVVVSNDDFKKPNTKPIDRIDSSRLDVFSVEIVPESDNVYDQQCELTSADYVCTDTNSYEQNDEGKTSLILQNLHRYSTGIQSSIEQTSNTVPSSTETASFEVEVAIVCEREDTSNAVAESVSVGLGRENNRKNEKLNETVSESISIFAENEIVTSTGKAVDSQSTLHSPAEGSIFAPCVSVINELERYEGSYSWIDLIKNIAPAFKGDEKDAKASFVKIFTILKEFVDRVAQH